MEECERKFKIAKPYLNPNTVHSREFPKMHCILDWARGGQNDDKKPKGRPKEEFPPSYTMARIGIRSYE